MKILIVTNTNNKTINHIVDSFYKRTDLEINTLHQSLTDSKGLVSILEKIFYKLKLPLDIDNINKRLINEVKHFNPEVLFIIKGNLIKPSTLRSIKNINPNIILISWSLDDMYASHNRSLYYKNGLNLYDHIFTTKSYNLTELNSLGAKKVHFLYQAYSNIYHIPCKQCENSKYKFDVLFIGTAEKERIDSLNYLAQNGIKINIYGGGWNKVNKTTLHNNLVINEYDLIGSDYADAISCSKISLCFLRKINRDLHTSRSIEIPACKGFMIAERTNEHLDLFEENKEAVYFSNDCELLEKVKYYLENEKERLSISNNGYNKCVKKDYSYDNMVKKILGKI